MARRRSSRARLATVLVSLGTISVVLLVAVLTFMAREVLDRNADAQLASVRDGRQAAVDRGVDALLDSVAAMAADPGLVLVAQGLVQPGEADPDDAATRNDVDDEEAAAFLQALLASGHGSELLVVSMDTGEVVSTTSVADDAGPSTQWDAEVVADVVDRLPSVPVGDAVILDGVSLAEADGTTAALVAATVRSGPEVIAALLMTVPIDHLTDLVSADGQWDQLGLGASGEAVIVGSDGILRSEPRSWTEDPEAYLDALSDAGEAGADTAAAIEIVGSPVGIQAVENAVVADAIAGDESIETVTGPLVGTIRAAAAPVDAGGLAWVVIASQSSTDFAATLWTFLRWVGLLLLVLVPLILLAATYLSRALTRPIPALVAVSSQLAEGDLDVTVPDLGPNEFGDLARQLAEGAAELQRRRAVIADEEARIQGILSAVVPTRLMERVRGGDHGFSDVLETATVVAVSLHGMSDQSGADQETFMEATARMAVELEELAVVCGVEPVRAAARQHVFLAGLGTPDAGVDDAASFGVRVSEVVRATGDDLGLDVDASVGMAAGTVGTGMIGTSQVSFGIWGDPPGRAASLGGLARAGEVLVDDAVAEALGPAWIARPLEDVVGLSDDVVAAFALTAAPGFMHSG